MTKKALARMGRDEFERALVKSHSTPEDATWALEQAQRYFHLISPATSVGALPEGCAIVPTLIKVDPADTYKIASDTFGLTKTALNQIAAALGISWDPTLSTRLDDASDPNYAHYRAVGHYRAFDGQVQTIMGEKELDARDGSPQIASMSAKRIAGLREHVLSQAQTKAQLRAIRSLGVRTSYTADELLKPFCCARIMFTGQTKDPALRLEFARMTAESFIGGKEKLFGAGASQARDVDEPVAPHSPPAVGVVSEAPEDRPRATPHVDDPEPDRESFDPPPQDDDDSPTGTVGGWDGPPEDAAPPAREPEQRQSTPTSSLKIPGGRSKGTPLHQAERGDLEFWEGRISEGLDEDPSGKWADKNRTLLAAIRHELDSREEA